MLFSFREMLAYWDDFVRKRRGFRRKRSATAEGDFARVFARYCTQTSGNGLDCALGQSLDCEDKFEEFLPFGFQFCCFFGTKKSKRKFFVNRFDLRRTRNGDVGASGWRIWGGRRVQDAQYGRERQGRVRWWRETAGCGQGRGVWDGVLCKAVSSNCWSYFTWETSFSHFFTSKTKNETTKRAFAFPLIISQLMIVRVIDWLIDFLFGAFTCKPLTLSFQFTVNFTRLSNTNFEFENNDGFWNDQALYCIS